MNAVLVETGRVMACAAGTEPWRDFDLSVTLSQRQLVHLPTIDMQSSQRGSAEPGEQRRIQDSSFPLRNYRWGAAQLSAGREARPDSIEFDPQHEDFVIDLQWTSSTNLPFFRIRQVFVTVRSAAS